jgi:DNA-binding SARP family transcriptional activator
MVWMESGRADQAVSVLRGELKRRKDHVLPYIFAVALLRSGVDPATPAAAEAVEALRASIRAKDEFAPSHAELGRLLFKRDDLDLAVRELERAAALDPGNTQALYFLAQAYRKKGDRARAQELLSRVSKVNAEERGDDPGGDLRRAVVRIVREGTAPPRKAAAEP